jgi:quercetin dioxygenase-like cupin family protein
LAAETKRRRSWLVASSAVEEMIMTTPAQEMPAPTKCTLPRACMRSTLMIGNGSFVAAGRRRSIPAAVASCAVCGITEFVAAEVSAQGAPAAATAGVTRKVLPQTDGPMAGYVTVVVEATIEADVSVARHTHPGIESAYVLEGGFELPIEGQPTRVIKAGDAFQIPPETPHAGGKAGDTKSRILITYVVDKSKPLASPA